MREIMIFTEQDLQDMQDGKTVSWFFDKEALERLNNSVNGVMFEFMKEMPKKDIIDPKCNSCKYYGGPEEDMMRFMSYCPNCKRAYKTGSMLQDMYKDLYKKKDD